MFRTVSILILAAFILVFAGFFAYLNQDSVALELAFAKVDVPGWQAYIGMFVAGWVFGLVCGAIIIVRLMNQRRKLRKAVRLAEAEVSNLRTLPMQDAG